MEYTRFTKEEIGILETTFQHEPKIAAKKIQSLAESMRHPFSKIYGWFKRRRKRGRIVTTTLVRFYFTNKQKKQLEAAYKKNPVPTNEEFQRLSNKINIGPDELKIWFDTTYRNRNGKKPKTREQEDALKESYKKNKYLSPMQISALGERIGLDWIRARSWFSYHRKRDSNFDSSLLPLTPQKKTSEQLAALNDAYQKHDSYPPVSDMYKLADCIGLSIKQVRGWFSRKRIRDGYCENTITKRYKRKVVFSEDQVQLLRAAYQRNHKPVGKEIEEIVRDTGLTSIQVRRWFTKVRMQAERVAGKLTNTSLDNTPKKESDEYMQELMAEVKAEPVDSKFIDGTVKY